jgi:hypothetical protein
VKHQAIGSTKMKRLCRFLRIPRYQATGILEELWHLTGRDAPAGDIGKLSNEDIALGIDYMGNEDELVESLVKSGWLDRSEQHRLIVHDWHEHSEDSVDNKLARAGRRYASGHQPRMNRMSAKERASLCARFSFACDDVHTVPPNVRTDKPEKRTTTTTTLTTTTTPPLPLRPREGGEPSPPAPPRAHADEAAPPYSIAIDEELPEGLADVQYAFAIFERSGIVNTHKIRDLCVQAIGLLARSEHLPNFLAARMLESRVKAGLNRGDTVNAFWFEDGKWRVDGTRDGPMERFQPGYDPAANAKEFDLAEWRAKYDRGEPVYAHLREEFEKQDRKAAAAGAAKHDAHTQRVS